MKDAKDFDEQMLGAFVDGELDAVNRDAVMQAMEIDAGLRDKIYQLRRTRDLMQVGFGDAGQPSTRPARHGQHRFLRSTRQVASIAVLAVTFGAGMLVYHYMESTPSPAVASVSQQQSDKLILHVSQSDQRLFEQALDYTEKFLHEHASSGNEIEVVAHANGLDLLREDLSPLRARINRIIQDYDNVHFIACANAIKQLRARGTEPRIIQGVHTDSTAFDHIVSRLQSGEWKYIKVESLPET